MGITFNADEIFEMAEQIERNGAKFYRLAAVQQTEDEDARKMLLNLAVMEDEHEKTFAEIRSEIISGPVTESVSDPDDLAALYLRVIADGRVFDIKKDPSEILSDGKTLEEILKIAISLEKDSIVFYMSFRDMVPKEIGKEKIDYIINEEKQHIVGLSNQLAARGK
ncbi:ferritin family protein [Candidatus Latescibacterota bacterium]